MAVTMRDFHHASRFFDHYVGKGQVNESAKYLEE